jgi:hypothetical protein
MMLRIHQFFFISVILPSFYTSDRAGHVATMLRAVSCLRTTLHSLSFASKSFYHV